ncbi:MAG: hypothetical protein ABJZ55_04680 [Fuerstiella sp.]
MPGGEDVRPRWMIYALGGGAGHLTRVTALARAAVRRFEQSSQSALAPDICILTNSPFARVVPVARELGDRHRLIQLDHHLSHASVTAEVRTVLAAESFDVLVVDTFPRGLGGELPEVLATLSCPKVLIHRDLNPNYVEQHDVEAAVGAYDLIVVPGESAAFDTMLQAVRTEPWLIRDCDQLRSVAQSRTVLGATDQSKPVVVVMGSGTAAEIREMERLAAELDGKFGHRCQIRFTAPNLSLANNRLSIWPLLEVMPGIDIMIGNGGYNTVNEVKATGTRFIGIARERLYDRQQRRLLQLGGLNKATDVAERLNELLVAGVKSSDKTTYVNGVHQAVRLIVQLVSNDSPNH